MGKCNWMSYEHNYDWIFYTWDYASNSTNANNSTSYTLTLKFKFEVLR